MKLRKQSFLERLTGTQEILEDEFSENEHRQENSQDWSEEEDGDEPEAPEDAGIPIDMYETDNEIVIQSMIAGVISENLHVAITSTTVTISGKRLPHEAIPDENYIERELYWGSFSRHITLPFEVETDGAEAVEKYGLLIIRLPKLDHNRPQKLKVKSL